MDNLAIMLLLTIGLAFCFLSLIDLFIWLEAHHPRIWKVVRALIVAGTVALVFWASGGTL